MGRRPIGYPLCIDCGKKRVAVWDAKTIPHCGCGGTYRVGTAFFSDGSSIRDLQRKRQAERAKQ